MTATQNSKNQMPGGWNGVGRFWFERQSKNKSLPAWQRVAYLCYANMRRDGHCPMPADEVGRFLGKTNKEANRTIKRAIDEDYLSHGSNTRCLIAPYEFFYELGSASRAVCEHH